MNIAQHTEQLSLFQKPIESPRYRPGTSHEERFQLFHARNPHVLKELTYLALLAQKRGRKVGIKALFEALRWERSMRTDAIDFKLNNNFHSLYARLIMDSEPRLAGFFATRSLKS